MYDDVIKQEEEEEEDDDDDDDDICVCFMCLFAWSCFIFVARS